MAVFVREALQMKVCLFLVGIPIVQVLLGSGALRVLYGRLAGKMHVADKLLVGFLVEIGLAEVAHLAAVVLGRSFSDAVLLFEAGIVVLSLASIGIWLWQSRNAETGVGRKVSGWRRRAGRSRLSKASGRTDAGRWTGRTDAGSQSGRTDAGRRTGRTDAGSQSGRTDAGGWSGRSGRARVSVASGAVSGRDITPATVGLFLAFALLFIYQIVTITSGDYIYRAGDMTVETVESFLETDGVYQVNPLTGRPYKNSISNEILNSYYYPHVVAWLDPSSDIPFRIQILCLPTLYGILCRIFGLSAARVVWELILLHVLLMCYLAFDRLAHALFADDKRRGRVERLLFMTLIAAVLCAGDYLYGMDGFGLLYCGFRGVTIRNVVLLPYVFGLALRRRWRLAALCILAEACIVWTLYGMGACLVVTLGMAVLRLWYKKRTEGFEEAGRGA
ncbi:MAG: DUF6077 domain-containing protein [Butyrivibrio sp.]|nr:DUF6077 domain-containing protein [Muribaculum sp.]MCM1553148.1 DUF6077 domain-containing protein [Butyrivibrio sp.]